jgi:outer membrane protein assembly factor BamD
MGFSPYLEKSRWRICESLMALSPNYFHDQDSSLKAITEIQQFLDDFPNSEFSLEADKLIKELRLRLAQKNMESGYLYVKLKAYDSAIKSFEVVVNDYYDTKFIEDAHSEIIKSLILLDKIDESNEYFKELMDNPAISSDVKSRVKKLSGKS